MAILNTFLVPVLLIMFSLSLGKVVLRLLRVEGFVDLEELSFGFLLGFGLISYLIFFFGLMGLLSPVAMIVLLFVGNLVLFREVSVWWNQIVKLVMSLFEWAAQSKTALFLGGLILGLLILAECSSILPPTAHDALAYQLAIPKQFALHGQVVYLPYLVNSLFPFLIQMLYSMGIVLGVGHLAGYFHYLCFISLLLGVLALTKRLNLESLSSALAVLVVLVTPGMYKQAVLPLNDIALAGFSFFAVYAIYLAVERDWDLRLFILAGVFSGFALSVKYLAGLHIIALGVTLLVLTFCSRRHPEDKYTARHPEEQRDEGSEDSKILRLWLRMTVGAGFRMTRVRKLISCLAVYGLVALLFSFVWYLRSYIYTGNPLFPFFPEIFGGENGKAYDFAKQGYGKGVVDFFLVLWRATFEPQNFGGSWTSIGVVYLIFLPWVIYGVVKKKLNLFLVIFCAVFFIEWFFLVQNLRFLYVVLPFFAILICSHPCKKLGILLLSVVMLQSAVVLYNGKDLLSFLKKGKETYVSQHTASYTVNKQLLDLIRKDQSVIVFGDIHLYYYDFRVIRGQVYRERNGLGGLEHDAEIDFVLIGQENTPKEVLHFFEGFKPIKTIEVFNKKYHLYRNDTDS